MFRRRRRDDEGRARSPGPPLGAEDDLDPGYPGDDYDDEDDFGPGGEYGPEDEYAAGEDYDPGDEHGRPGGYAPRHSGGHGPGRDDGAAGDTREDGTSRGGPAGGPWDAGDKVPPADRVDFGSLQVPAVEGLEIQIGMADDQAAWVSVVRGQNALQLQAFAAPKSGGLWDEVREEIAGEVARAGGQSQEADGPFGPELHARVAAAEPGSGRHAGRVPLQPVRFLGVDGPRWFLRGVISGPAATGREQAKPLERVFGGVVVVRGDHPAPPRDLLEIQLPEEARQALAEQAGQMEDPGSRWALGPFERGPEITETR